MAIAVATFGIALALIATERVQRTKIALLGAAIVVLFVGEFSQEEAIEAVDFNTIGLLAGMMILVYVTQQTGVYDYIAIRAGQLSRGDPFLVVLSLAGTTAVLSAFLDNLTTILLVVPITFLLADTLDIDPIPLIVIEVIASIKDPDELRRTVPVLVLTVIAFFAHQTLHIEPATVALTGAAIVLLVTREPVEEALAKIEWPTLFFFVALFVMVGALEESGAIGE